MSYDPANNEELRKTVGDSFNIYQATVAMCSIFMGFVFAALIQILSSEKVLLPGQTIVVWFLVFAMLSMLTALLFFHATAHQVIRLWSMFLLKSPLRLWGQGFFVLGIIAMLLSVAFMLYYKSQVVLTFIVGAYTVFVFPLLTHKLGNVHSDDAPYLRSLDQGSTNVH